MKLGVSKTGLITDKTIRLEYVLGLLIAMGALVWQRDKDIARIEQAQAQRPELVERRNREIDQLTSCMRREIDILRTCK